MTRYRLLPESRMAWERVLPITGLLLLGLLVGCGKTGQQSRHGTPASSGAAGNEAIAGGNSGGVGGAPEPPATAGGAALGLDEALVQACGRVAAAYCGRFVECSPVGFGELFISQADCERIEAASCGSWFSARPSANRDPSGLDAKAMELEARTCGDIVQGQRWPYTTLPGTAAVGSACNNGPECETGYCDLQGDVCGTCQEDPQEDPLDHVGEPCEIHFSEIGGTVDCEWPGLVCDPMSKMCVPKPGPEEPCLVLHIEASQIVICDFGLECRRDLCVEPLFYGDACSVDDDRCDSGQLVCGMAGVCEPSLPAHVEGECGGNGVNPGSCGYLDECVRPGLPGYNDAPGTCVPRESSVPGIPQWGLACK